jgi:hypothetical protein
MSNVVIVSKDQQQNIEEMRDALKACLPSFKRVFAFDRCFEGAKKAAELGEKFVLNETGSGFMAGYTRDLGLNALENDDTLFLDGDRIPSGLNEELVLKAVSLYDICLIRIENDCRTIFTKDEFTLNPVFQDYYNNVYTCGFVIKKEMISKIKALQEQRLFNSCFDGFYGEEDEFLGNLIFSLGGSCGLFPKSICLKGSFRDVYSIRKNSHFLKQCDKRRKLFAQIDKALKLNKQLTSDDLKLKE